MVSRSCAKALLEKVIRADSGTCWASSLPVLILLLSLLQSRDQCQWWPSNRWHVGGECSAHQVTVVTNSTGHSCWSSLSSLSSLTTRHNYIKHDIPVISDHPRQHSNILRFPLDQIREDVVASRFGIYCFGSNGWLFYRFKVTYFLMLGCNYKV